MSSSLHDQLRHQGYLHLPALVDEARIRHAREAIALDLEAHYDAARELEYSHRSHCPALRASEAITALRREPALAALMEALLPWHSLRFGPGQIAIRWAHNVAQAGAPHWHIDGVATAHNGVTGEELDTFTLLVGVFLSRTPRHNAGNFTVWPGSHARLADYFRRRGPRALREGMPRPGALGEPHQLVVAPGDVVIAHYLLAHAAADNDSDTDRLAVYFRGALPGLKRDRFASLRDCWRGWHLG